MPIGPLSPGPACASRSYQEDALAELFRHASVTKLQLFAGVGIDGIRRLDFSCGSGLSGGVTAISDSRAAWLARNICPHEPALRHWLSRRSSRGHDIDDAVQEAYARLAMLPSVDHIANPRAYFFRTVLSMLVNEARRAQVVSIETLGELERLSVESHDLPPDQQAESRQELRQVAEAIAQLPPKCRDTFILRKVHGLSQRETAEQLGIAESTVEKHVGRGVRHLVKIFGRGGKSAAPASIAGRLDSGSYDEARGE